MRTLTREQKEMIVAADWATGWTDLSNRDRYEELMEGIVPMAQRPDEELDETLEEMGEELVEQYAKELGV